MGLGAGVALGYKTAAARVETVAGKDIGHRRFNDQSSDQ
jgi:hypothetical protein